MGGGGGCGGGGRKRGGGEIGVGGCYNRERDCCPIAPQSVKKSSWPIDGTADGSRRFSGRPREGGGGVAGSSPLRILPSRDPGPCTGGITPTQKPGPRNEPAPFLSWGTNSPSTLQLSAATSQPWRRRSVAGGGWEGEGAEGDWGVVVWGGGRGLFSPCYPTEAEISSKCFECSPFKRLPSYGTWGTLRLFHTHTSPTDPPPYPNPPPTTTTN